MDETKNARETQVDRKMNCKLIKRQWCDVDCNLTIREICQRLKDNLAK